MDGQRIENDQRFHPVVESTSAAIFVLDSGRIVSINPACRELTGQSARNLLGSPFAELVHPRFRSLVESGPKSSVQTQIQIFGPTGNPVWLEISNKPIIYRGSPAALITAFDISSLKESDLARRDTEVQLKLVQRAGRTVSWDWDATTDELVVYGLPGKILTQNAPFLTTTAKAVFEYLDSEDLLSLKHAMRRSLNDREPLFLQVAMRTPDGKSRCVVLRGQPIPDIADGRGHIVGVATDITDRFKIEQALLEEQEKNLAVLASISDGVIRTDLEGRVEEMTAPAEKVTGLTLEAAQGKVLADVLTFVDESGRVLPDPVSVCLDNLDTVGQPQTGLIRRFENDDIPVRYHTAVLRDRAANSTGAILVLKDLVEHKQVERGMVYLATHDPLTDLLNRTEFERQLGLLVAETRFGDRKNSLLYMDLDGFKLTNTTFGHSAGDKILKQFASFLKCRFRETDVLGRIGGDKFAVLLEDCSPWQARELVEKVYQDLRSFGFEWENTTIPVCLSTGMASIAPDAIDMEKVLGAAETACYIAKKKGGASFHEYEAHNVAASERQTQIEVLQQIQEALRSDSFRLHIQRIEPQIATESNPLLYEVLLRMQGTDGTLIRPDHFIPVAERHRIMTAVDRWVVADALATVAEHTQLWEDDETLFAINISGQSLGDDRFLEYLLSQLSYRGVQPNRICIEITETATVANFDRAQRFISVLKGRGCRFVLDDFGSGLSSFAYLRKFPVDFIKIDGQFVLGLTTDPTHRALVESINHVGHVMQIKTIAESVETPQVLDMVRGMKVDYAQGHGIAPPEPIENILRKTGSSSYPSDAEHQQF